MYTLTSYNDVQFDIISSFPVKESVSSRINSSAGEKLFGMVYVSTYLVIFFLFFCFLSFFFFPFYFFANIGKYYKWREVK